MNNFDSRSKDDLANSLHLPRSTYRVLSPASRKLNPCGSNTTAQLLAQPTETSTRRNSSPKDQPKVTKLRDDRHLTFNVDKNIRRLPPRRPPTDSHHRASRSTAYDVTTLDHHISKDGGTTSTLEYLPHRLKISKQRQPLSLKEQIEELTRENGYLRQELAYHKDTRETLMKLYKHVQESNQRVENALRETSEGIAISEQQLLDYWGIHHDDGNAVDKIF